MEHDKKCDGGDVVIPKLELPDGKGYLGIRHRDDHTIEPCLVMPARDGDPLPDNAELAIKEDPNSNVFRVHGNVASMKAGPAKVNSRAYHDGWDRIFRKPEMSRMN